MSIAILNRGAKRLLCAIILWCGLLLHPGTAQSASVGDQFDGLVADAKAAMLVNPAQAIDKAKAAQQAANALPGSRRPTGVATAQWLQGEAYLRLGDVVHARPLIDQAFATASAGPVTKLTGDILLSRGGLHTATAQVAAALADYQQAYNLFRGLGETRSRAIALLSIALLYQEAGDYRVALRYYDQAREIYTADPQLLLSIFNNRGNALKELGQYSAAELQFREAFALAKTMHSPAFEARVLSNVARSQLRAGQLDAADRTISQGFAYRRLPEAAGEIGQFWALAARSSLQHGDASKATELIARGFTGIDLLDREAHETAYQAFKRVGDEKQALSHLEALKKLDDQTSKLAASTNTALAAARFDFANQELRIAKLRNDDLARKNAFERSRAETQRMIFAGAAIVAIIIVALLATSLIVIRRSRNEVRAANVDLAASNVALAKALAAKTEFLATTSHEIRTPLNGILGMTQVMLADARLESALRDRIGIVHSAGVTMRALVDDILDVAKIETGNLSIEQAPFDLKEILRDVCRLWQEQARDKGLSFALDLDNAPRGIEGDAARLRQIVFNLLSNAIKFTDAGTIRLTVATVAQDAGERVRIAVADNGIGIPADKLGLIFESFRQVDSGTTRRFGGTGLGLSICRNLARAMGGDVSVESLEGQGSIFTVDLPLVRVAVADCAAEPGSNGLLIVDRNPITRAMLRTVLAPHASDVSFAASAEEAAGRLALGGIAQVLIDDATVKATEDVNAALREIGRAAVLVGARTTLLWSDSDVQVYRRTEDTVIDQFVAKPISGARLTELIYGQSERNRPARGLVTRAA
ncbi:tetratricopeptide repeat protein [Sphingomonas sp. NFR15]|uniref:tetratricopeptide repeat protein n=1 Tax=Sphingomonas sp. NFR15 TaxID=1566282 RepID=UPI00087F6D2E|nr:tetratricopeptide repeat protein [Sphingomonas sp. NFR15]SDA12907.1 Signal transduction histidine kinase [Sphingomonas sp. NFR15]